METSKKTREELERIDMIDTWLKKHRLLYLGATKHPFILSIRDGTVDLSHFKTWLVRLLPLISFIVLSANI